HVAALVGQPAGDVRVRVPVVVVDLDEAHAALDHAAAHQHRVSEGARPARVLAVQAERRFRLAGQVGQLRHAGLHAEGHLVLLDARVRLGVADGAVGHLVELPQAVEGAAADLGGDARRVVDVEDRVTGGAEGDAGVLAGQVTGRPQAGGDGLHLFGVAGAGDE